jgi:hypothetical protein
LIVTEAARVLEGNMARNQTSFACRRIVIDDRCRLPGRFFGRFATSATSELRAQPDLRVRLCPRALRADR